MRTTRWLSTTLPNEMAEALRGRVQSGGALAGHWRVWTEFSTLTRCIA